MISLEAHVKSIQGVIGTSERVTSRTRLEKGAIEYVPHSNRETGFYRRYFIVPKKDGRLRPILDLRVLNISVMKLKFKMLTLRQIVSQIRSEDWFVTIDLKDTYFHISILPYHRKFLRFAFGGKAYQYRVLPFGLALSPRTFTKCVDAALVPLRLQGIRIMNYIDVWLILAKLHQLAVRHRDVVLAHIKNLGLRLNAKKSVLSPVQRTTFMVPLLLIAPRWPCRVWFPNHLSLLDWPLLELPVRRDLLSQAGGLDISPSSRTIGNVGLASEGAQLINSGLSTKVVETILHYRAPSTRKLYALKWKVFTSWCSDHQLDTVNCPVGTVLEFLQD